MDGQNFRACVNVFFLRNSFVHKSISFVFLALLSDTIISCRMVLRSPFYVMFGKVQAVLYLWQWAVYLRKNICGVLIDIDMAEK